MDWILLIGIGGGIIGLLGLVYGLVRRQPRVVVQQASEASILRQEMAAIPNKVLQALKSSTSNIRGSMAEHISFLKLSSDYDRLIPIGNVVDFIGIKFDTKKETFDGHIDFIDIKTGKSRLTADQMKVKRLAEGGRTRFIKVKINTDSTIIEDETHED